MRHTPSGRFVLALEAVVLTVVGLYFGQPVLMPLVTAVLLTFLLRPSVVWLERRRFPRPVAVGLVALAILAGFGAVGWAVTVQLHDLALHLDDYRGQVHAKLQTLKRSKPRALENLREIADDVAEAVAATPAGPDGKTRDERQQATDQSGGTEASAAVSPETAGPSGAGPDVPTSIPPAITVAPSSSPAFNAARFAWNALSNPLAMIAVTAVLVVFMLAEFEDMRNRLLRLAGQGNLTLTTRTLDDIGRRVSRFLTANAVVNGGFGLVIFVGLLLIGVHYAALWGFLAAALRFVPYVGPITAALLPIAMSILRSSGWMQPALVTGLFIVVELITNNVVEPLTYGRTAGVSTVALLISAAFWAWVWGPVGLMLAVPITVVLAVLGRHLPQFDWLAILLGDEPALATHETFYQRLVAGDADEAAELLDEQLAPGDRLAVYDRLVVPALALAERDCYQGRLEPRDKELVWRRIENLIEEQAPAHELLQAGHVCVTACPAEDEADELTLTMLSHVAPPTCALQRMESDLLASEKVLAVTRNPPHAVLISALGPGGTSQVRYLCKRLRHEFPRMRIIVGRWNYQGDRQRLAAGLQARGADQIVTTLQEAVDAIERIQPLPLSA
ncbi:MAG: AI-2E family transporter [Planctomycetaceae bacterium]